MMIAAAVMGVVVTAFLSILASVEKGVARESDRSNNNDQARLALQEIDKEIRSGSLLYDPAGEPSPSTAY